MGALDDEHYNMVVLENGVKFCEFEEKEEKRESFVIEEAVKVLLQGLGEDVNRDGIKKTPLRVAKALIQGTKGYKQNVKEIVQGALFPEIGLETGTGHAGGTGGLVLVRDLDLFSYCESCLLPFHFKCHIGYIPSGQRVVGLSKLSRVADIFAKRLQDPQRLADEICLALQHGINPSGVAVVLQCSHIHFPNFESAFIDSNHKTWAKLSVRSGSGSFEKDDSDSDSDSANWVDFFGLLRIENIRSRKNGKDSWCPSRSQSKPGPTNPANPAMERAVASIIRSIGQDPSRKELAGTPKRFVKWLTNFKHSNLNGLARVSSKPVPEKYSKQNIRSEINLPLWSLCEHHLLPFHGSVHIGYISSEELTPVTKSLLGSIVHFHGFKLQVQERLTRQIAETVCPILGGDVMVVVEASHTCMISRGIEKVGSSTATIAVLGRFSDDFEARSRFLQMIPSYTL